MSPHRPSARSERRRRARFGALGLALIAAAGVSACGSSGRGAASTPTGGHGFQTVDGTTAAAPGAGRVRPLKISPAHPSTRSVIRFGYVAPAATGARDGNRVSYSLSVTGPARGGCVGVHEAAGPPARAGAREQVEIGPAQLGADWCAGLYTARVVELEAPVCKAGQACPQYIRVVATVAAGRFTTSRG